MTGMKHLLPVVVLVAGMVGCAARPSPMVESPKAAEPAAPSQGAPAATMAPSTPQAEEAQQMPGTTHPPTKKEGTAELAGAAGGLMEQFNAAEVLALSSGRDCSTACKALRSMNNAAEQLCSLAQDDRERERCARAKERVRAATQRVKDSCGQCAGGPALE